MKEEVANGDESNLRPADEIQKIIFDTSYLKFVHQKNQQPVFYSKQRKVEAVHYEAAKQ